MIRVFLFDDSPSRHEHLKRALEATGDAAPAFDDFDSALASLDSPDQILDALASTRAGESLVLIDLQFVRGNLDSRTGRFVEREIPATPRHWEALRSRVEKDGARHLDGLIRAIDKAWPLAQREMARCTLGAFLAVAAASVGRLDRCRIVTSAVPDGPLRLIQSWGVGYSTWGWNDDARTALELKKLVDEMLVSRDPRDGVMERTGKWFASAEQSVDAPVPHMSTSIQDRGLYRRAVLGVFPWLSEEWIDSPGMFSSLKSIVGAACCQSVGVTGHPISIGGALLMFLWACETKSAGWTREVGKRWPTWPADVEHARFHPRQDAAQARKSALWLWRVLLELTTSDRAVRAGGSSVPAGLPEVECGGTGFRAELPWPRESSGGFELARRVGVLVEDMWGRIGSPSSTVGGPLILPGTTRGAILGHALDSLIGASSVGAPGFLRVEREARDAPVYLVVRGSPERAL